MRAMAMCWPAFTSGSRAPVVAAVVFTVSCSSQQGASACNDGGVVRVAVAPRTVVLFLELLVLVVAVLLLMRDSGRIAVRPPRILISFR